MKYRAEQRARRIRIWLLQRRIYFGETEFQFSKASEGIGKEKEERRKKTAQAWQKYRSADGAPGRVSGWGRDKIIPEAVAGKHGHEVNACWKEVILHGTIASGRKKGSKKTEV
jgi:hypothetical protein